MLYTVGCVPYVNAVPLVVHFERLGENSPVEVRYEVPSRLPGMLARGEVQAALVSSIEALRSPGMSIAAGCCISSQGPVESVRLFSRVPFEEIRSLALDASSLTSNALAQIVLSELYGAHPTTSIRASLPPEELVEADACVLIGDLGMESEGQDMKILDLGEAWHRLTGKPFVWAAWIGGETLTPELAAHLDIARTRSGIGAGSEQDRDFTLGLASAHSGWPVATVQRYLEQTIRFGLGAEELAGLAEFRERLLTHGLLAKAWMPEVVMPARTG